MIFDSIILKLKGIMYLVYFSISEIHLLLFIIAESCYVIYKSRMMNLRELDIMYLVYCVVLKFIIPFYHW